MLERRHHPQGLRVVVEAAMDAQARVERPLAGMAERRVAEVVGERQRLGQILIEPQLAGERAGDLGYFQGVGQAGAVMIAFVEHENLGFVLQAPESRGMNHPVAVAPERAAGPAWRLRKLPPAAQVGVAGIDRARGCHSN